MFESYTVFLPAHPVFLLIIIPPIITVPVSRMQSLNFGGSQDVTILQIFFEK